MITQKDLWEGEINGVYHFQCKVNMAGNRESPGTQFEYRCSEIMSTALGWPAG